MAEVTTKKRGRPAKKQSLGDEVLSHHGNADVGDDPALPKTRGSKTAARKPASSSSKASLASTATAVKTKPAVAEVAEASTGGKTTASASAKRKAPVVVNKNPDSATPSTGKTRKSQAKSKPPGSQREGSGPVPEGGLEVKAVPKNARASLESNIRPAQESWPTTTTTKTTTTTTPPAPELLYPRQSVSEILRHAKAFSKQSDQLQLDILQLIGQKEAACTRDLLSHVESGKQPTAAPTSQTSSEADAIPISASESSAMAFSTGGTTNMAAGSASNPTPSATLTNESLRPFPTQTIASLSQQQTQSHPPPSLLSSPIAASQPQHQVRPYSSTKALPMSTTIALAARQHNGTPSGSKPSMPPRPTIPPEVPRAPKLSELPLEQLKKDPRYRKASTRYTSFVVALPFAIVTSYFLWERYREHQAYLKRVQDARAKGPGTEDSASTPVAGQRDRE